jgi:hypothetical protein
LGIVIEREVAKEPHGDVDGHAGGKRAYPPRKEGASHRAPRRACKVGVGNARRKPARTAVGSAYW